MTTMKRKTNENRSSPGSSGKGVALITGASAGIGAVYADRLVRRGYDLVLVARDEERMKELAGRLAAECGVSVEVIRADLIDKADLARVEARLRDDRKITMLVNNAGIAASGPFVGSDLDYLERLIELNAIVVMRLAGAIAPGFVARGGGTIVNISSVTALQPETFNGTYSATKAFVLAFSQALREEIGKHGVTVQAVLPGGTRTEIWERSGYDVAKLPLDRFMSTEAMVDAALAGLDQGEFVTIPALPETADWETFNAARLALWPNLTRSEPADRYRPPAPAAAQ